jgi:cell division protease FtsH
MVLTRAGRFDRQILVDKPDLIGREAILNIHSRDVKLGDEVDLKNIAKTTPGFVGSDLANIVNEAALLAVRAGRKKIAQEDFEEAIEKVVAGLKKKNRLINDKERKIVAYHETGHALVAAFTPGSDPVQKISIVPRGFGALGYTLQMPTEDRYLMTRKELISRIDVLLGGRAAEQLIFEEISTGAANDLVKSTDIAKNMITEYGMSEKFLNVALTKPRGQFIFPGETMHREYSEATQQYIDEEVARVIDERYRHVLTLLEEKIGLLNSISAQLLEEEIIGEDKFKELISKG